MAVTPLHSSSTPCITLYACEGNSFEHVIAYADCDDSVVSSGYIACIVIYVLYMILGIYDTISMHVGSAI